MNDAEIKKVLMDVPIVLCRNMNNRFVSSVIKGMELDLSHHHLMIMRTLYEKKSMYATELVEFLGITKPQMTASIDHLVTLGFVIRRHDENDRRKIFTEITKKGKEMTKEVLKRIDKTLSQSFKSLSAEEIQMLGNGMKVLFKMCRYYEGK